MYLYIFDTEFLNTGIGYLGPGRILVLPKAPLRNVLLTQQASVIFSFHPVGLLKLMKNRYDSKIDELAKTYLGIRVFDDGFFISDKDLLIFTLKYQGLTSEKVVDFPLL